MRTSPGPCLTVQQDAHISGAVTGDLTAHGDADISGTLTGDLTVDGTLTGKGGALSGGSASADEIDISGGLTVTSNLTGQKLTVDSGTLFIHGGSNATISGNAQINGSAGSYGVVAVGEWGTATSLALQSGLSDFGQMFVGGPGTAGGTTNVTGNVDIEGTISNSSTGLLCVTGGTLNVQGQMLIATTGGRDGLLNVDFGGQATVTGGGGGNAAIIVSGSYGAIEVHDAGSKLNAVGGLALAQDGTSFLYIKQGGAVEVTGDLTAGSDNGASGSITVSDNGSSLTVTGNLILGKDGEGDLTMSNGASLTVEGNWQGGVDADGTSTATLGDPVTVTIHGDMQVGMAGAQTVVVDAGTHVNVGGAISVAAEAGSQGNLTVTGTGSELDAGTGDVTLAGGGTANVVVANGAIFDAAVNDVVVADEDGSVGFLTVTGQAASMLAGTLTVGNAGVGLLDVLQGGDLSVSSDMDVGKEDGGLGDALVDNASLDVGGDLTIGGAGTAVLLLNGASASVGGTEIKVGEEATGIGTFTLNKSTLGFTGGLTIGDAGNGLMIVRFGSKVGSPSSAPEEIVIGNKQGATGELDIDTGAVQSGEITVGHDGEGELHISNSGKLKTTGDAAVGDVLTGQVQSVLVDSKGYWGITGGLTVGGGGIATVTVAGAGNIAALGDVTLGESLNSSGLVTVTGSVTVQSKTSPSGFGWGGTLIIGNAGFGSLVVQQGALAAPTPDGTGTVEIGALDGSTGSATVDGAKSLFVANDLSVGGTLDTSGGAGSLTAEHEGTVRIKDKLVLEDGTVDVSNDGLVWIGGAPKSSGGAALGNSSGTVYASSSAASTFSGDLVVISDSGTLIGNGVIHGNVVNEGTIEAKGGNLIIDGDAVSNGTVQVDEGASLELGGAFSGTITFSGNPISTQFAGLPEIFPSDFAGGNAPSPSTSTPLVIDDVNKVTAALQKVNINQVLDFKNVSVTGAAIEGPNVIFILADGTAKSFNASFNVENKIDSRPIPSLVKFTLTPDGAGGTNAKLVWSGHSETSETAPIPILANPGDMVSLASVFQKEGFDPSQTTSVFLQNKDPTIISSSTKKPVAYTAYWDTKLRSKWYVDGVPVPDGELKEVAAKDYGNVFLQVGTNVGSTTDLIIRNGNSDTDYKVFAGLPPSLEIDGAQPDPEALITQAKRVVNEAPSTANQADCYGALASIAGSLHWALPENSGDPFATNATAGYWTGVYHGAGSNLYDAVSPGDIVREQKNTTVGDGGPHAFLVTGKLLNSSGQTIGLTVIDNQGGKFGEYRDLVANKVKGTGNHTYQDEAGTISVYRLNTNLNRNYLIDKSGQTADLTIEGNVLVDDIKGGSGNDTIVDGPGGGTIDGGGGINTVVLHGNQENYTVGQSPIPGYIRIVDQNRVDGTVDVKNVKLLKFKNGTYNLKDFKAEPIRVQTSVSGKFLNKSSASQGINISGTAPGIENDTQILVDLVDSSSRVIDTVVAEVEDETWSTEIPPTICLALPDDSYTLAAVIPDPAFGSTTFTVRQTAPTVSINPINRINVINAVQAQHDLTITGASTGAVGQTVTVTLNGVHYTGTVASDGTWSVTVPQANLATAVLPDGHYTLTVDVTDQYGNVAKQAAVNLTVHETGPAIVISETLSQGGDVQTGQIVQLTLNLSGAVTVNTSGGSPTLTLNDGGTAAYDATRSDPSSGILTYDYTVASGEHTSNLALSKVNLNGATVRDSNGNADFSGALNMLTGLSVGSPLAVSSVTSSQRGAAHFDQTVQLTLTMSEAVLVDTSGGSPTLLLNDGASAPYDAQESSPAAGKLVFDYSVGASDQTPNLAVIDTSAGSPTLTLSDGATATYDAQSSNPSSGMLVFDYAVGSSDASPDLEITDVHLNNAKIQDIHGVNADFGNALYQMSSVQIGPSPLTVSSITATQTGNAVSDATVQLSLAMKEPVAVISNPGLVLNDGAIATYDQNASSPSSGALVFDYTVGANDRVANLQVASVVLNGTVVQDATGYNADFSHVLNAGTGLSINSPLTVNSVTASQTGEAASGTVHLTLAMSEGVTVSGSPTLSLNDGATATYDSQASHSASGTLVFDYAIAAADRTANLVVAAVNMPGGATAQDASGYNASFAGALQVGTGLQIGPAYVTSLAASQGGAAHANQTVTLTLSVSEGVTVTGAPTLTLNDAATATYDAQASNPAGGKLVFDYSVGNTDKVTDLKVNSVNLPAGTTIQDVNHVAADLSGAIGVATGLSIGSPLVASSITASQAGNIGVGATVQIALAMSEAVTVSGGIPTLALNDGAIAAYDAAASTASSGILVFDYTVQSGDYAPHLQVSAVNLNGATVRDSNGYNADFTAALSTTMGVEVGAVGVTFVSTAAAICRSAMRSS
jgi:T5SS/PEP-CTERM-associated repeat protein